MAHKFRFADFDRGSVVALRDSNFSGNSNSSSNSEQKIKMSGHPLLFSNLNYGGFLKEKSSKTANYGSGYALDVMRERMEKVWA